MSFNAAKLQPLAQGGGGFTLWHYDAGADTNATVDTANYFQEAYNLMNAGDVILVKANSGAAIGLHWVNSKTGGNIDVTDALALTATDTD